MTCYNYDVTCLLATVNDVCILISVNWIVKVTMDYDCTVRMAILQVCLTEKEFHDFCDILCQDLFLADKGEFDLSL